MEIPHYPASRPIGISDKPLLDRLCDEMQPRISELSFAGLYLFRKSHAYRLSLLADSVVVQGAGYDGSEYFLPPLGGDTAAALKVMFADGRTLYGPETGAAAGFFSADAAVITPLRDSFDYLYLREDLALLPGSRFHKKKNRINYFTSRHDYSVDIYSDGYLSQCLELLKVWTKGHHGEASGPLLQETDAAAEALHCAGQLGLEGVVIRVNGRVAAFALGERLNRDTSVCHFEKADPFVEGLFQLVNREFARLLFQDCRFINREQDLGDAGLRSAKLSYHPVELVNKYLVSCTAPKDFVAL